MDDLLLTVTQALQLVALAPCVFIVVFLLCAGGRKSENFLPIAYFFSLSASFVLPLLTIFGQAHNVKLQIFLLLLESVTLPLSYLLLLQFLRGRFPAPSYWLILALPLLGGSPFLIGAALNDRLCFRLDTCIAAADAQLLFNLFSATLVLLLSLFELSHATGRIAPTDRERKHKYWLILALIGLNVLLAFLDLLLLTGQMTASNRLLAATGIRIAFIYVVLTSIFRVFYDIYEIPGASRASRNSGEDSQALTRDLALADRIRALLEGEQLYREMKLTRKLLADRLAISEGHLSRIIGACFRQNFNELVNGYRIAEAKERLRNEPTPVTTIAFEVGFNSIASFNRVFKEETGAAPTAFRQFYKDSPM